MKITKLLAAGLATVAAILLVGPGAIQAETLSYDELAARLTALESQVQSQSTDFASYNTGGGPEQFGCKDCSKTVCNCGCPAWYAGYEMTILRPYVGDANFGPGTFGDDYGVGHRFVLGYDNGSGLGARLRYWMYNHNHGTAAGAPFIHIDMDVLDGEVTLQEQLHNWDLMASGGLRYARSSFNSPLFGPSDIHFEGIGPTVSLEATRCVGSRGVYLVGNFRGSMLFGQINGLFPAAIEDEVTVVLENQLGLGWTREFGRGIVNLRAVWESQFWLNDTLADDFNGFGTNLGFSGPTASVEIRL